MFLIFIDKKQVYLNLIYWNKVFLNQYKWIYNKIKIKEKIKRLIYK
jgi:hypothetical protein